jgi:hypothetical protein
MEITPDLIPHDRFHQGSWLQAELNPGWYYFMERKCPHRIRNRDFFKSVDKPLKELVRFLHEKGISTTPSCSGHHFPEGALARIYDGLCSDAERIRSDGLWMNDIESNERFFFRQPGYHLPWSKEEFLKRLGHYQQKGVLGLSASERPECVSKLARVLEAEMIRGVHVEKRGSLMLIFVTGNGEGDNDSTWYKVTRSAKRALRMEPKVLL